MPEPSTTSDIFLCHASEDKGAVRELYYRLRDAGIQPWIDEEDLSPGQRWQEVIHQAVQSARIVVVCLSKTSIDKRGFVQEEIQYALDVAAKKTGSYYIVPARLELCDIPDRLKEWQWVDLFDPRGFDRLLRALGTDPRVSAVAGRDPNLCSVVLDGSQFSVELMVVAREAGFNTRQVMGTALPLTQPEFDQVFSDSGLIILVRGDHFQSGGNLEFFRMIKGFVAAGGFLFATPWVSWETSGSEVLNDVLPFTHPDGDFEENLAVTVATPGGPVTFPNSFEHLAGVRPGATQLASTTSGLPLLGIRDYLKGCCLYLNVCQHSCEGSMESPLNSCPPLREFLKAKLVELGSQMKQRFPAAQASPPAADRNLTGG
jgi:TIR domain